MTSQLNSAFSYRAPNRQTVHVQVNTGIYYDSKARKVRSRGNI